VEATEEELLASVEGFTLLLSGTRADGAVDAGRGAVEGGGAGCQKEEEGAVLACPVDVRGVKVLPVLFLFLGWCPCNSFSANMARWNKRLIVENSL
jgi:hypothetical protein